MDKIVLNGFQFQHIQKAINNKKRCNSLNKTTKITNKLNCLNYEQD